VKARGKTKVTGRRVDSGMFSLRDVTHLETGNLRWINASCGGPEARQHEGAKDSLFSTRAGRTMTARPPACPSLEGVQGVKKEGTRAKCGEVSKSSRLLSLQEGRGWPTSLGIVVTSSLTESAKNGRKNSDETENLSAKKNQEGRFSWRGDC